MDVASALRVPAETAAPGPPSDLAGVATVGVAGHGGEGCLQADASLSDKFALAPSQLQEFVQKGYLVVRPKLPDTLHRSVIETANAVYESAGFGLSSAYNSSPVGNNILAEVPELQEVFSCPEVDGALRSLLGEGYVNHPHRRPHQNDPGSRDQRLHRDSAFGFEPHRAHAPWWIMAMYYPQRVERAMAPTSLCPGTQYYGGEGRFDVRHLGGQEAQRQLPAWESREVAVECEAGTVVLLHNDLWHRGTANSSSKRRWMFCFMFVRTVSPALSVEPPAELCRPPSPGPLSGVLAVVSSFLAGAAVEPRDVNVAAAVAALRRATDDRPRLEAAYALALARDAEAASRALASLLTGSDNDMVRRAAKFGAAAACRQQLLQGAPEPPMVQRLLELLSGGNDALATACAARALLEHGAWEAARPELRLQVAQVLAEVAVEGPKVAAKPPREAIQDHGTRPEGAGSLRGHVRKWVEDRSFGSIQPEQGGDVIWVGTESFGGGSLMEGGAVWFDVVWDARSQKNQAANVAGPGVRRAGGRTVGTRNARAAALEALAAVPRSASDLAAATVAEVLATTLLNIGSRANVDLVGRPARQADGEALMAAAFGALRLVSQCAAAAAAAPTGIEAAACAAPWWPRLRAALLAVVRDAGAARPPAGARKPGSGGMPGADQGLRYTVFHALDAFMRAGDTAAVEESRAARPARARGPDGERLGRRLQLRRCHLTTPEHSF